MKKIFLITGVIVLGLGILIMAGCGGTLGNPMMKVLAGSEPHALEFPFPNPDWLYVSTPVTNAPVTNTPLTVEAWIKITDLANGGGSVFSRGDAGTGVELYVRNADGAVVFAAADPDEVPSFVEAAGTTNVMDGSWHHVAGVLSPGGHNHTADPANPGTTCDAAASIGIHVDVYVDGEWENCAGPFVYPNNSATEASMDKCRNVNTGLYVPCTNNIGRDIYIVRTGVLFAGIIDEVRLWSEDRSEGEIDRWKDQEISGSDWDDADPGMWHIMGYWKFNTGTGNKALDSSGYGNNGTKWRCINIGSCNTNNEEFGDWMDGWVEGYPFN